MPPNAFLAVAAEIEAVTLHLSIEFEMSLNWIASTMSWQPRGGCVALLTFVMGAQALEISVCSTDKYNKQTEWMQTEGPRQGPAHYLCINMRGSDLLPPTWWACTDVWHVSRNQPGCHTPPTHTPTHEGRRREKKNKELLKLGPELG